MRADTLLRWSSYQHVRLQQQLLSAGGELLGAAQQLDSALYGGKNLLLVVGTTAYQGNLGFGHLLVPTSKAVGFSIVLCYFFS